MTSSTNKYCQLYNIFHNIRHNHKENIIISSTYFRISTIRIVSTFLNKKMKHKMVSKLSLFITYCVARRLHSSEITAFHAGAGISPVRRRCCNRRYMLFADGNDNNTNSVITTPNGDSTTTKTTTAASSSSDLRSVKFANLKKEQEPQLLCNFLMELGACSTSIVDSDRGTCNEQALFDEFDTGSMTRTAVTTHCWNQCDVNAHFPASTSLDWIMDLVRDVFPNLRYTDVSTVENKDWVSHVQRSWNPVVLPPFVLRFPWHTDKMVQAALEEEKEIITNGKINQDTIVELELQGGIAFGTGEHPTTQLCLQFVSDAIQQKQKLGGEDMMFMDYGAGSGVLGMAACKLDSSARAIGVDIDVDAVHIANANAETNHVDMNNYLSDLVQTTGDDESTSIRLKAYSSKDGQECETLPDRLNGPIYDALVANILAQPLVSLAPTLSTLVKPGALLGLSGIMTSQSGMVQTAYEDYFDDIKVEKELLGWVLITGTRKE